MTRKRQTLKGLGSLLTCYSGLATLTRSFASSVSIGMKRLRRVATIGRITRLKRRGDKSCAFGTSSACQSQRSEDATLSVRRGFIREGGHSSLPRWVHFLALPTFRNSQGLQGGEGLCLSSAKENAVSGYAYTHIASETFLRDKATFANVEKAKVKGR